LRVWRISPDLATFHCVRCGESGYAADASITRLDEAALERSKLEARERERTASHERTDKARWLWSKRHPLEGTIAERYLRIARGYHGQLPATLGFLPAQGKHAPAMIAAFGRSSEPVPGELSIASGDVRGVHITRLAPDGGGKAGTASDKIVLGASLGSPIVLAPVNDLLALVIAEGIEDALSAYEATLLGAWAAGCASRMPALAKFIPAYIEAVTIMVDDDPDGRRYATKLHDAIKRSIEVRLVDLSSVTRVAA
jgi:hypothetical protein